MDTFKTIIEVLTQPEVLTTVLTILGAFGIGASKVGGERFKTFRRIGDALDKREQK